MATAVSRHSSVRPDAMISTPTITIFRLYLHYHKYLDTFPSSYLSLNLFLTLFYQVQEDIYAIILIIAHTSLHPGWADGMIYIYSSSVGWSYQLAVLQLHGWMNVLVDTQTHRSASKNQRPSGPARRINFVILEGPDCTISGKGESSLDIELQGFSDHFRCNNVEERFTDSIGSCDDIFVTCEIASDFLPCCWSEWFSTQKGCALVKIYEKAIPHLDIWYFYSFCRWI